MVWIGSYRVGSGGKNWPTSKCDSDVGRRAALDVCRGRGAQARLLWKNFEVRATGAVVGGRAAAAQRGDEQFDERSAEQSTHGAVQYEVDRTVDDHDDVPDVAQLRVDLIEEALVDAAEEGEHALRQLGDDEAQHDGDQHRRRAIVFARLLRLQSAAFHLEQATAAVGATHRHDQQGAENGQQNARDHLEPGPHTQRALRRY